MESGPVFLPCIGTMKRWPSPAGGKAPINRTHSKRFALADESMDHALAFGVRASSAPLSQSRLQFDGRVGSWRTPTTSRLRIGTMKPLRVWSPGFSGSKTLEQPEGGTLNQPRVTKSLLSPVRVHWHREPSQKGSSRTRPIPSWEGSRVGLSPTPGMIQVRLVAHVSVQSDRCPFE